MNIYFKATHLELSDASRALIEEKLAPLSKFLGSDDETAKLEVEIEQTLAVVRSGASFRVEGNLTFGGELYRAEAMGETLEAAVDKLRYELSQELRRARGRARHYLRRGGAAIKSILRGFHS